MAQNPLNDLAGRLNKAPKGVGLGIKLLALGGAAAYGVSQSMFTGILFIHALMITLSVCQSEYILKHCFLLRSSICLLLIIRFSFVLVEGGHRAIVFNRIGGIQNDVFAEGLHFRIPWFQYPIVYDIRCVPSINNF